MPTQTKENYLKAVYFLDQREDKITVTDLSREMGVSAPTANNMIKKMKALGWIEYEKYKPLKITEKGRKLAALIIRKHRLAEMFLTEVMKMGWEEVHDIAEDLEHIQSEKFFTRMDEMLDHPDVDPHGSPIPDRQGNVKHLDDHALSEIPEGTSVIVTSVRDSSSDFLEFLNQRGISLGTRITVQKIEDYDKSMAVLLNDKSVMITQEVSRRLMVKEA